MEVRLIDRCKLLIPLVDGILTTDTRNNKVAMASIASLNLNAKEGGEARNWYKVK